MIEREKKRERKIDKERDRREGGQARQEHKFTSLIIMIIITIIITALTSSSCTDTTAAAAATKKTTVETDRQTDLLSIKNQHQQNYKNEFKAKR